MQTLLVKDAKNNLFFGVFTLIRNMKHVKRLGFASGWFRRAFYQWNGVNVMADNTTIQQ